MSSKGKKPMLNNDDSVDIDEMLRLLHMKHQRMFKEAAPPVLAAEDGWRSTPLVQRQGVNAGGNDTSALYLGGSIRDNVKDLSYSFSGMNMSSQKEMIDDEQNADEERLYLEKFVNSIVDEPYSSTLPNPNSVKPYHSIGSSSSSNYRPGAPINQHANAIQLQNFIRAQNHILQQAYLHSLQQAALQRPGGSNQALGNSNMALPELAQAHPAVAPAIQFPQNKSSLLGKPPMLNQNYIGTSAYRPAMSSIVRIPDGSNVSDSPNRSIGLLDHGDKGSGNSNAITNLGTDHASLEFGELRKSNNTKIFELVNVAGHLVELSKDHYGSRFLQLKLQTASPAEMDMAFREIIPHALTLMSDLFGNYIIQKFFEYGSTQQQTDLVNQMVGRVYRFSLDIYSCRVVQKALETVEVDQKIKLARELKGHVMRCIQNKNGNHVIQKCIQHIPEYAIHFILSPILEQVRQLCTHEYGCRVIQRVLESCHSKNTQMIVMGEIVQYATELADNLYGNYVLQLLLQHGPSHVRSAIIKNFTGLIVHMSTLKYSSNVIEKCVTYSIPEERKEIVDEIMSFSDGFDAFQVMMTDRYANYVVQRVLETCAEPQLKLILNRVKIRLIELQSFRYAKHILSRLEHLVTTGERRVHIMRHARQQRREKRG